MKKKKGVLWGWTLSYLCLLLIPITSIFINYYSNITTIKKEYINAYYLTVDNLKDNLDSLAVEIQSFYNYILSLDSFHILKAAATKNGYYYYNAYSLQSSLKLYTNVNDMMSSTIYFQAVDHISSTENTNNSMKYYSYLCNQNSYISAYDDWKAFISNQYKNTFFISHNLSTTNNPCLIFANTLTRGAAYQVNVFTTISTAQIETMTDHLPNNICLVLQTPDNELHTFDNTGYIQTPEHIRYNSNGAILVDDGYLNVSVDSEVGHITCHLVISKEALARDLQETRGNFIFNLIITLLLGLIGIIILLHKNYRPISHLLQKIGIEHIETNEFQCFENIYEQLQMDYHSTRMTIQSQKHDLLNGWLLSLLKGRINELDMQKQKENFELDLESQIALVGFMIPPTNQQDIEYDELIFFIVDNIFRELFAEQTFYQIEDGRFIYYLFDLKKGLTNWHSSTLEKIDYLCDFINEKWGTPIVSAISKTAENIRHCKFLYRDIMDAFELQSLSGSSVTIDTRDSNHNKDSNYIRDTIELELNDAVKKGNLDAALKTVEKIFAEQHDISFAMQKIYAFDAFIIVIDIFNEYTTNNALQRMNAINYVTSLMQASNIEELRYCFKQVLEYICGEISLKLQSESKDIALKIYKYIEENYTNQDLSVSAIADYLNRNPKYLSRVFKSSTGDGILDCINNYRISKAKDLILTGTYTLEEIAEQVGYSNVRAFRRAFVKITGDIPSKFNK